MEQISYDIVLELAKKPTHIRDLSRKLKTNHTTISRKLKQLEKENIIDYEKKGKNKTYKIKNSTEAKTYLVMSENHKLLQAIKKYPYLRRIIDKIKEKKLRKAIIFGSHANFTANKNSDIDLFLETKNKELEQLNQKLSIKTGNLTTKTPLGKEILKNHLIIQGAEEFHNEFFEKNT